jgi:hypothetical protein
LDRGGPHGGVYRVLPRLDRPAGRERSRPGRAARGRGLCAYWRVDVAGPWDRDGACFVSPAFWYSSSASNAVPVITSAGAVLFRCVCTRWRNVCSCLRDIPNSRAKRAVGSPLAMPRSRSTSAAGRWRVFFKDGVGQERIVAVTRAATVGREGALLPEESVLGAMTVRAGKAVRMQVTL